jgi:hypothetical protein
MSRSGPMMSRCMRSPGPKSVSTSPSEPQSVLIRGHLETGHSLGQGFRFEVLHEQAGHPLPHPVWVDEEVVQLEDPVLRRAGAGEAHDSAVGQLGNGGPAKAGEIIAESQSLWVSEQGCSVAGIGQRCPQEYALQRRHVVLSGSPELDHAHHANCVTMPSSHDAWTHGQLARPVPEPVVIVLDPVHVVEQRVATLDRPWVSRAGDGRSRGPEASSCATGRGVNAEKPLPATEQALDGHRWYSSGGRADGTERATSRTPTSGSPALRLPGVTAGGRRPTVTRDRARRQLLFRASDRGTRTSRGDR